MSLELLQEHRCFGGTQAVYRHQSTATGTPMEFSIFLPPQVADGRRPVLYWLSGLTCTWANFTEKAGVQRYAAGHGLIIVCPDTSPRGSDLPGEHDDWDLGSGAGFYVDATAAPWSAHYKMYSYVADELRAVLVQNFPVDCGREGIFGHSMGGHGALTIAFKNPNRFRSLSAFAPIVAPTSVPWGEKAFTAYLGADRDTWRQHDACALLGKSGWTAPILIDQGMADPFLETQLQPDRFVIACKAAGVPLLYRRHEGYDHSYYFIASFIGNHIAHHARHLAAG